MRLFCPKGLFCFLELFDPDKISGDYGSPSGLVLAGELFCKVNIEEGLGRQPLRERWTVRERLPVISAAGRLEASFFRPADGLQIRATAA